MQTDDLWTDSDLRPWRLVEVQKDGSVDVHSEHEKNPLLTLERVKDRLDSVLEDLNICQYISNNHRQFDKAVVDKARKNLTAPREKRVRA